MLHKQITVETEYYMDEHYTERYTDTMLHVHSTILTECYTGTMLFRENATQTDYCRDRILQGRTLHKTLHSHHATPT